MVQHHMEQRCMAPHNAIWHGTVWHTTTWHHTVWHHRSLTPAQRCRPASCRRSHCAGGTGRCEGVKEQWYPCWTPPCPQPPTPVCPCALPPQAGPGKCQGYLGEEMIQVLDVVPRFWRGEKNSGGSAEQSYAQTSLCQTSGGHFSLAPTKHHQGQAGASNMGVHNHQTRVTAQGSIYSPE